MNSHIMKLLAACSVAIAVSVCLLDISGARAQTPKRGGTVTIAKASDASSLDPHDAGAFPDVSVYANIYDTLVYQAPDMRLEPALAARWRRINDTTVRFFLRRGVKFSDGTPFNAQAVKFNLDRELNPRNPARLKEALGSITGARVVDDYTVDVITSAPYPLIVAAMSYYDVISMVSPAAAVKYGKDYGSHPVGTGPFLLQDWVPNDHITLVRNPNYWGAKPYLDRVVFKVIPDAGARLLALKSGQADIIVDPPLDQVSTLRGTPGIKVYEVTGLRTMFFGFNMVKAPTDDRGVRRAINEAIDRDAVANYVLEGTAVAAQGLMSPSYFGYADLGWGKRYPYDPEKAKATLQEDGWSTDGTKWTKGGRTLQINEWAPEGRYPKDRQIAESIQDMLKKVGMQVQLNVETWSTYISDLGKASPTTAAYNMYLVGWAGAPDADYALFPLFSSTAMPPKDCCNWSFYKNGQVDVWLDKARSSLNANTRLALYKQVQDQLADGAPWVPLVHLRELTIARADVQGYVPHPFDYYKLMMGKVWLNR